MGGAQSLCGARQVQSLYVSKLIRLEHDNSLGLTPQGVWHEEDAHAAGYAASWCDGGSLPEPGKS